MSHIFISYSKQNRSYATSLADRLRSEGFDVWIDDRIDYGEDWWDAIDQAIQGCSAAIVIMTPESKSSRWVQREVSLAEHRKKPVFPLLLSGENWSIFVRTQYVSVTDGVMPPPEFYLDLARHVPRNAAGGKIISTQDLPRASTHPDSIRSPTLRQSGGRAATLVAAAIVTFIAIVATILAVMQSASQGTRTPTPAPQVAAVATQTGEAILRQTPTPATPVARSLRDGIPVRTGPNTNDPIIRFLDAGTELMAIGVTEDQTWFRVLLLDGSTGWITGGGFVEVKGNMNEIPLEYGPFVTLAPTSEPTFTITNGALTVAPTEPSVEPIDVNTLRGVNLDLFNPLGTPGSAQLGSIGWVRLIYNVSYNPDNGTYGNVDLDAAYNRYRPVFEQYADAGYKVILVLTHQTYGEGQGYLWSDMDTDKWSTLIGRFTETAGQIAEQYAGTGLVSVYQIWQEQDTSPEVAFAAVPVPPEQYANMLTSSIQAIRAADSDALVITGGHIGGPARGASYARATINAMPVDVRPDGIAIHSYGRGPQGNPFSTFGSLDEEIQAYSDVLPDKPIWITEWGVLDREDDSSIVEDVSVYADGFMQIIASRFPGQVAAAVWYAWADGMNNGYGLVDRNDQPKQPLYDAFLFEGWPAPH